MIAEIADADYVKKNLKPILPVPLTDQEIAELAKERAKEEARLEELELEAADSKKEWSEKLTMQERIVETMGADIRRGKQDRVVMCDEVFRGGCILTIRQDNGVVVGNRPASPQEAQRHLPAIEGGSGILDDAARAQKEAGVEEDDEGDVIAPAGDGVKKRKSKKAR